jgi:tetratricopeptide (TPR) repeat protein
MTLSPAGRMAVFAALAGLGACATHGPDPRAWQVTPVYRVQHAQAQFDGHYATARYLEGQRRWAQAEVAYRRALALQPTHVEAHNRLALTLAEQGRLLPAIEALRQALALDPQAAHLLNNLGYLQLQAGERDDAVSTLRRAVELNPRSTTAEANLRAALTIHDIPSPSTRPAEVHPVVSGDVRSSPLAQSAPPLVLQSPTVPALILQHREDLPAAPADVPAPSAQGPVPTPDDKVENPQPSARIELSNGNGVAAFAARVRGWLGWLGVKVDRLTNQRPYRQATTLVQYREGYEAQARELARQLPLAAQLEARGDLDPRADVRVVLGHDFRAQAACLDTRRCTPPALAATSGETLPQ